MKTKRALVAMFTCIGAAGTTWAAVSLDITKPPVTGGVGTGPLNDPNAFQGQWFADGTVRDHEFHDNVLGNGGGLASTNAIRGVVTSINGGAWSQGAPITSFTVSASITNDTPTSQGSWMNGFNSHSEVQGATNAYVGDLVATRLVAEFALADLTLQPVPWNPPYTQIIPEIVATNEDTQAWYCYTVNQGNYYVPTWDYGTIPVGQTVSRNLSFTINGVMLSTDSRYNPLAQSFLNNQDILTARTLSLKISDWVDTVVLDGAVPPYHVPPEHSSNASVFHNIPEAGTAALIGLFGVLALLRRR